MHPYYSTLLQGCIVVFSNLFSKNNSNNKSKQFQDQLNSGDI